MRIASMFTVFALAVVSLTADDSGNRTTIPVADAVEWYSVWFGSNPGATPGPQTCRGELRGPSNTFRCDPLSVVVAAVVDEGGHCSITSMRPSVSPDDGLRVHSLEQLVPPGVPRRKGGVPQDCGEMPLQERTFQLVITPHSRLGIVL
jgi:hypothetical protein